VTVASETESYGGNAENLDRTYEGGFQRKL